MALRCSRNYKSNIMNNDLFFGGKNMLSDDFRQLFSIKIHGTRSEIVNLSNLVLLGNIL